MKTFEVTKTIRDEKGYGFPKVVGTVTAYTHRQAMSKAADNFNAGNWADIFVKVKGKYEDTHGATMRMIAIQKSEYPGFQMAYSIHFKTGIKHYPDLMLPCIESQYNDILDFIEKHYLNIKIQRDDYSIVHIMDEAE